MKDYPNASNQVHLKQQHTATKMFNFLFINLFTIYFTTQSAAQATWRRTTGRLKRHESTGM
jgi:hypothetical protein